jgi:hypothetical protein
VSPFTGKKDDKKYPIKIDIIFNFHLIKNLLNITWKLESPLINKIINKYGEGLITLSIQQLQPILFNNFLSKMKAK